MRRVRRGPGSEDGGALVELAIALPVLLVLLMGVFEAARFVVLSLKLDNVAGTIGDIVARSPQLTVGELDAMLGAADDIAAPFDILGRGAVLVSCVGRDDSQPSRVFWQRRIGSRAAEGGVGPAGGPATVPGGLSLEPGETAIVAESLFGYTPLLPGMDRLLAPRELRHVVVLRPRFGTLAALGP